jgi:hypothetical protein
LEGEELEWQFTTDEEIGNWHIKMEHASYDVLVAPDWIWKDPKWALIDFFIKQKTDAGDFDVGYVDWRKEEKSYSAYYYLPNADCATQENKFVSVIYDDRKTLQIALLWVIDLAEYELKTRIEASLAELDIV